VNEERWDRHVFIPRLWKGLERPIYTVAGRSRTEEKGNRVKKEASETLQKRKRFSEHLIYPVSGREDYEM